MINNAYQNNLGKAPSRLLNIEAVRQVGGLVHPFKGTLNFDWAELAGKEAMTYQILTQEGLLPKEPNGHGEWTRYVGVDRHRPTIKNLAQQYQSPDVVWVPSTMSKFMGSEEARKVGVLNFDSHNSIGRELKKEMSQLFPFAERQYQRCGSFLLILNVGRNGRAGESREKMTQWLAERINYYCKSNTYTKAQLMQCFYKSDKGTDMCNIHIPYGD